MRDKIRKWWQSFTAKHKFSVSGGEGDVRWHVWISPANLLVGLVTFVLVVFVAVVLTVAYTPVMDTIPGYPGQRSRQAIVRGLLRLDSLEREMAHLTVYSNNIDIIMEGRTPVIRDVSRIGDSVRMQDKSSVATIGADSVLRARMEGSGPWSLSRSLSGVRSQGVSADFVTPIRGLVGSRFSPVEGRFGVEFVTADLSPVSAVRDGTVILRLFVPGEGHLVQVQHSSNLVSTYRGMSDVLPSVGVRVKAGEVIGTAGPLVFELWYNGSPVDPQNYIVF